MGNKQKQHNAGAQDAAASNKQRSSGKAPESEGYDKKLDGPNRPAD
ncbi:MULTISPECIES: hypothetical protein [Paenibacillus]|uniref:YuzL family protein n=1 Tax=Paenibacillus lignilyticus TaxID=1172615 RepID=A0ABS5C8Z4_9BACL|nr:MULTISPECIES: hypothetical protein [Paenibacillus]MBP3962471.1 hypothetical protein [Paenibacillus lignilyticus]